MSLTSKTSATPDGVPPLEASLDLQEQVRRRAFELYEQRGREEGHELDDWLQAESEIVKQRAKTAVA
jgi:hypothetical protein